jgi:Ca2+-binding RTX toxin-like protein
MTGTASGTGATTVNFSGSNAVAGGASTVSKLDASGLTAALTVTTSANMLDVKGGSGDDGITALTGVKNVIDGGAGTDTLTTGADMSTSTFSNIEILKLGANTDVLASQISGKTFVVTAANALEINAANSMDISTVDLSTLVPDLSAKPTFVIDATTGFKAATFNTGQTFDLTGSSVNDTINGYANADTIKGGDGDDTIDGKAGADNIDGGAGADGITGGTGADIITTGAGADTVNVGVADASASAGTADAAVASTTGFDTITDFTVGATGDKIDVGAASSVAANAGATTTAKTGKITAGTVTFNAADDTLAEKIIAAEAAMGNAAAGEACMFQHESDAYILVSDGTDTLGVNDALIKLTGIDTTATTSDVLTNGAGGTFTIV